MVARAECLQDLIVIKITVFFVFNVHKFVFIYMGVKFCEFKNLRLYIRIK